MDQLQQQHQPTGASLFGEAFPPQTTHRVPQVRTQLMRLEAGVLAGFDNPYPLYILFFNSIYSKKPTPGKSNGNSSNQISNRNIICDFMPQQTALLATQTVPPPEQRVANMGDCFPVNHWEILPLFSKTVAFRTELTKRDAMA